MLFISYRLYPFYIETTTARPSVREVDFYLTGSMRETKIDLYRETRYGYAVNLIPKNLEDLI